MLPLNFIQYYFFPGQIVIKQLFKAYTIVLKKNDSFQFIVNQFSPQNISISTYTIITLSPFVTDYQLQSHIQLQITICFFLSDCLNKLLINKMLIIFIINKFHQKFSIINHQIFGNSIILCNFCYYHCQYTMVVYKLQIFKVAQMQNQSILSYNIHNFMLQDFGDLQSIEYTLSFFINIEDIRKKTQNTQYFIIQLQEDPINSVQMFCYYVVPIFYFRFKYKAQITDIPMASTNWIQILITVNNYVLFGICDYTKCKSQQIITQNNPYQLILFQNYGSNCWFGQTYGITLYRGTLFNYYTFQNTMQPEVLIDLNIQEKIQSSITFDQSDYQFIAKLGEQFGWDDEDPYLINNSLIFNSSQFIYIKDPQLMETYTIEFKIEVSQIFTSNIILLNYNYSDKYQLFISLNQNMQINVYLNGQNQWFNLLSSQVFHFLVVVNHKLELIDNYFQIHFIQLNQYGILNKKFAVNIFSYLISPWAFQSGRGDLYLGSSQNWFDQNQYIKLVIFRLYLGFHFDEAGYIDKLCQFYLNGRCIICKIGYVLSLEHICVTTCSQTQFTTSYVKSHNQCIRNCNPKCATCTNDDENSCLICNGIRIDPPICKCPAGYFEDGVSPNCRKYFQEQQTQSGSIIGDCRTGILSQTIIYDRPYKSTPKVDIFLQGIEQYLTYTFNILEISAINFKVQFSCYGQKYMQVQWISSIGNDNFYTNPLTDLYLNESIITVPLPQIINNILFNNFLHFRQLLTTSVNSLELEIQNTTEQQIQFKFQGNQCYINLFQSNFMFYEYSSYNEFVEIQLDNIPKSILVFNLIQGVKSTLTNSFNIKQKIRSLTQIKLQNTYHTNYLKGVLLFASSQCQNKIDPCDFYESYITSCNLEYSLCKCDEIGYFINSMNQCQRCNHSCRTCNNQEAFCTSCNEIFFFDTVANSCYNCHLTCKSCSGILTDQCLSCTKDRFLASNNQCFCQLGYYEQDSSCELCDKRCLSCMKFSLCLSCHQDRQLDITTNSCNCPEGQYELINLLCLNCNLSCKTCDNSQTCLSCYQNRVLNNNKYVCADGYYLSGQDCLSCHNGLGLYYIECKLKNCFDGIWTPYEECDDNNQIIKDGCSNCIIDSQYQCINRVGQQSFCFKCQQNCSICQYDGSQIICNQCQQGYFLQQNLCTKCSELCQTCIDFQANCLNCALQQQFPDINSRCQGCDQGYYLKQDKCIQICSDGIKTDQEDCDDGNLISGDGCDSNCSIEDGFHCTVYGLNSLCFWNDRPRLIINKFQKLSNQLFFIQVQSTQIVRYDQISLLVKFDQVNKINPFYSNYTIQETKKDLQILQINLTITFNTSITTTILNIIIEGEIFNEWNQTFEQNHVSQQFSNIFILSDAQNKSSAQISSSANSQMIMTLTINCLSILISGSAQLSIMVRVNNILSYIKFIDIDIPPNLLELLLQLEQFNLIQKIDILQAYSNLQLGPQIKFEYIDPGQQFNKYSINANFIPNILPFVLNLITGQIFIYILQIQVALIKNIMKFRKKTIQSINSVFYKVIMFYQVYASRLIQEFKLRGKQQLIESSQYNILFSIFLQLRQQQFQNNSQIINFTLSIGFLLFYFKFIYERLITTNSQLRFQGFTPFNLIRTFGPVIYMFSIIFLQSCQLWQLLTIQSISMIMTLSLIKKPFIQMQFNIQILLEDIFLLLVFTSFVLFIYNPTQIDLITIGFIQESFIIFILSSNLLIQGHSNFCYIQKIYLKHKIKLKKQKDKIIRNQQQFLSLI
ncbi:hypothetical protein pb186bvf_013741 [Paramecium bursaria]